MIQSGDQVILYHSERMNYLVTVQPKGSFSTHRGQLPFDRIAGREFGDAIRTHLGFLFYLLKPGLADLAMKVKRSTTIVYPKDVGTMLLAAAVFPGARVVETGSGSGALTTILASFVRPDGRVYSYERRPEFSANARANVERYGLASFCEFFVRDPEHEGFEQTDVDAVLLDVPEPWTLVAPAHKALKGGYTLVSIVPTVEQVRRTVSGMEMQGFARIHVKETLEREMLVRTTGIRPADRMVAHTVYTILGNKVNEPGLANVAVPEPADSPRDET
ncbi:tRNA (adenine-N1)-methyltransferase [candidate division WOR-3 bacterium]|nr:tRNA (adenine-N1)-methyltransferase [candidate division WOR-3 bacterium]